MISVPTRRPPRQLLSLFAVLAAAIAGLAYWYYVTQKGAVEREIRNQLLATADLKVRQITDRQTEKLGEVEVVLANRPLLTAMERLANGKSLPDDGSAVQFWMETTCRRLHFANAIITDTQGNTLISAGRRFGSNEHIRHLAQSVVRDGGIVVRDLHIEETGGQIHLGLNAALRHSPGSPPFGALLLALDPNDYLYPTIEHWPMPRGNMEVALVRRDGDAALFLNELRYHRNSALQFRVPFSQANAIAVKALLGTEGPVEGMDYRGIPVFAAARRVPDTAWVLIVKMDAEEVRGPLRRRSEILGLLAASLLLAACGGISLLWRRQQLHFYRAQYQAEAERQALVQSTLAAVEQSEARFRKVVESAPEGIFVESGTQIRYVNPAAARMFGASDSAELIGQPLMDRVHPEDQPAVLSRSQQTAAGAEAPMAERRYLRTNGEILFAEVSAVPIEYDGAPSALVFFRDIGERKRTEEQHARLEEQLLQAQKMESVGRLAGGIAHDFNNLLTVINGYSDLLLKEEASPFVHDALQEIHNAGTRAASLTGQLLAFSRKQIAKLEPLNLNEVVEEESNLLRRVIGENIRIVTSLEAKLRLTLADRSQMHQVLMNLIVNARDAMPSGGTIVIETANSELTERENCNEPPDAKGVRLSVTDNGTGMSAETRQKIFEPFFTTKPRGSGTGLGLSTVYGIVRQSGGYVRVSSELGRGTTFDVYLPQTDEATALPALTSPASGMGAAGTILVVEDQQDVRKLAVNILQQSGYHLLEAANGDEALGMCEAYSGPIDLLVTDVVMPGMTGRELAGLLVQSRPRVKVIYMSGYSSDVIGKQGVIAPDVDYLPKPFTPAELSSKVREVLGGAKRPAILMVDDDVAVVAAVARSLQNAGYRVVAARDGKKALQLVEQNVIRLVITDLVMPEMEGLEEIQVLRQRYPDLPVIAISGAFDGHFLKTATLLGALRTMQKPIDATELLKAVEELLPGAGPCAD
jgi:PAS domain S-box-containing protein